MTQIIHELEKLLTEYGQPSWSKTSVEALKEDSVKRLTDAKNNESSALFKKQYDSIIRKIKKRTTVVDVLTVITESLFSLEDA